MNIHQGKKIHLLHTTQTYSIREYSGVCLQTTPVCFIFFSCAMCMEFVLNTLQKREKNNADRTYFERHTMKSHTEATATATAPPTISILFS